VVPTTPCAVRAAAGRSREFQQRAGVIHQNVSVLAEQMREHRTVAEGRFGNRAESTACAATSPVLRDDIENLRPAAGQQRG
jgi:hypothetical protein